MKEPSQKEKFMREIERRIISGELQCGELLPPERELVKELGMSRTVIHAGLGQLASMGFIRTRPRKGYVVTDYLTEGTIAVLESIMHYNGGRLAAGLLEGLIDCRRLVEMETAALAAKMRKESDISILKNILETEKSTVSDPDRTANDFALHHRVAVASGNPFYPLILKSFEPLQMQFIETFYSVIKNPSEIYTQHEKLINAIIDGNAEESSAVMEMLLDNGEKIIKDKMK